MRQAHGIVAAAALALAVACSNDGPKNPVETGLCNQAGSTAECPTLAETSYFTITLTGTSCTAKGTTITVTSPVNRELTSDGCYESAGKVWTIGSASNGYPAGTELNFSIISDQTKAPPAFQLSGASPDWIIDFEDGGDVDFNDVVLAVHATPIP